MKKIITLAFFVCICANVTIAQNAIAKIKYEEAEEAYSNNNYELTIKKLNEAEAILGSTNPKILYLKINAQSKLINSNPYGDFDLLDNTRNSCSKYLKDYEELPDNEEKYKDIYKILELLNYSYPANKQDFDKKVSDLEAEKIEKIRAEMAQREFERALRDKKIEEDRVAKANAEAQQQAAIAESKKKIDEMNKNSFLNLGFATGDIGKYGVSMDVIEESKKVGFRMTLRTSIVSDKLDPSHVEEYNNAYTYLQAEKLSKFVMDLGPIFKISKPLFLYTGVGFGQADKYKLYKVNNIKTGTYVDEGYASFEGDDKMFFATSFAGIIRIGRVLSLSAGITLVNFADVEYTYGIAFNLYPKF